MLFYYMSSTIFYTYDKKKLKNKSSPYIILWSTLELSNGSQSSC